LLSGPGCGGFGPGVGSGSGNTGSDLDLHAASQAQLESCEAINTNPAARTNSMPFMLKKHHIRPQTASPMLF
jgi:hypothetical protein